MADGDLKGVVFNRGRLVKSPTSLSGSFPYGGTALGLHRDVVVEPTQATVELTAEEFGSRVIEIIDVGRAWVLGCNLRSWDNDAYSTVFPGITATAGSNVAVRDTLTARAGALMSSRAVSILFVPDDLERHRMIYIPKAIPMLKHTAELLYQLANEHMVPAIFTAIPDSTGRIYSEELKATLTL